MPAPVGFSVQFRGFRNLLLGFGNCGLSLSFNLLNAPLFQPVDISDVALDRTPDVLNYSEKTAPPPPTETPDAAKESASLMSVRTRPV